VRKILKIAVVWALALVVGLPALGVAAQKPKGQSIEGCTAQDLATPGAQKCLNDSVLSGSNMYVVCEADGSKKCCVGTGSDKACYDIVGRKVPSPAEGPRAPPVPRKVP
jgi:hypothetical protein